AQGQATHFLQIWILPDQNGIAPGYEQKAFPVVQRQGALRLVASRDGAQGSVRLHADAALYAGYFDPGEAFGMALDPQRKCYVHLVRGALQVNGQPLAAGDAALLEGEHALRLDHGDGAEVLVFDLRP
ncbi:MAG: quercetin 2,3-dioxygenase, partial [Giesbergeria sp.]|nr:quercetin 2,3-dioxygenase [Giesbergeria sp.]